MATFADAARLTFLLPPHRATDDAAANPPVDHAVELRSLQQGRTEGKHQVVPKATREAYAGAFPIENRVDGLHELQPLHPQDQRHCLPGRRRRRRRNLHGLQRLRRRLGLALAVRDELLRQARAPKLERRLVGVGEEIIAWPRYECSRYGHCGPFGYCENTDAFPTCKCLDGFEVLAGVPATRCGDGDRFLALPAMKAPDRFVLVRNRSYDECAAECSRNCSCVAYAYANLDTSVINGDSTRCLLWVGELIDTEMISEEEAGDETLHLRLSGLDTGAPLPRLGSIMCLVGAIEGDGMEWSLFSGNEGGMGPPLRGTISSDAGQARPSDSSLWGRLPRPSSWWPRHTEARGGGRRCGEAEGGANAVMRRASARWWCGDDVEDEAERRDGWRQWWIREVEGGDVEDMAERAEDGKNEVKQTIIQVSTCDVDRISVQRS
ncbi:hypothetical protein BS78_04G086500 [Paspalum vaginatum]|nr:hypothetical protein BS78_04G086500 [Paspalum vaginatum]